MRRINNHWKPVYLNCAPCTEPYEIIVKMESFHEDASYIYRRLGLNNLYQWRKQSADRTSQAAVDKAFNSLDPKLVRQIYDIYEPDFLLFGYNATRYFINSTTDAVT
jgi:hypothetical protein